MTDTTVGSGCPGSASWAADVAAAVAVLPPAEAAVVHAVYVDRLTIAGVAVRNAASFREVQRHLAQALRRIGQRLTADVDHA